VPSVDDFEFGILESESQIVCELGRKESQQCGESTERVLG
jgi:hypothetical protein